MLGLLTNTSTMPLFSDPRNLRRKTKKMIPNIGKRRKNEVFKIHLEQVEKTTFSVEGFYLNEKTGKKK
jgi:hypothetical protein